MSTVSEIKPNTESVITRAIAEKEVDAWLDNMRIPKQKRIANKVNIETLVNAIMDGNLTLISGKRFTQKLIWEIGDEIKITEFQFKERIKVGIIEEHVDKMKSVNMISLTRAYICALTNQPKEIINELDPQDYSVASAITGFFM